MINPNDKNLGTTIWADIHRIEELDIPEEFIQDVRDCLPERAPEADDETPTKA